MTDLNAQEARATVRVDKVSHFFGEGGSRNQVLFDNSIEIEAGHDEPTAALDKDSSRIVVNLFKERVKLSDLRQPDTAILSSPTPQPKET